MTRRRFVVICTHCRHLVLMPLEIGPRELERLRLHLRHDHPSNVVGLSADADATLGHFQVTPPDSIASN